MPNWWKISIPTVSCSWKLRLLVDDDGHLQGLEARLNMGSWATPLTANILTVQRTCFNCVPFLITVLFQWKVRLLVDNDGHLQGLETRLKSRLNFDMESWASTLHCKYPVQRKCFNCFPFLIVVLFYHLYDNTFLISCLRWASHLSDWSFVLSKLTLHFPELRV